jgi:hypothetical protein
MYLRASWQLLSGLWWRQIPCRQLCGREEVQGDLVKHQSAKSLTKSRGLCQHGLSAKTKRGIQSPFVLTVPKITIITQDKQCCDNHQLQPLRRNQNARKLKQSAKSLIKSRSLCRHGSSAKTKGVIQPPFVPKITIFKQDKQCCDSHQLLQPLMNKMQQTLNKAFQSWQVEVPCNKVAWQIPLIITIWSLLRSLLVMTTQYWRRGENRVVHSSLLPENTI